MFLNLSYFSSALYCYRSIYKNQVPGNILDLYQFVYFSSILYVLNFICTTLSYFKINNYKKVPGDCYLNTKRVKQTFIHIPLLNSKCNDCMISWYGSAARSMTPSKWTVSPQWYHIWFVGHTRDHVRHLTCIVKVCDKHTVDERINAYNFLN